MVAQYYEFFIDSICSHSCQSSSPLGLSELLLKVEHVTFWEIETSQDQEMIGLEGILTIF